MKVDGSCQRELVESERERRRGVGSKGRGARSKDKESIQRQCNQKSRTIEKSRMSEPYERQRSGRKRDRIGVETELNEDKGLESAGR